MMTRIEIDSLGVIDHAELDFGEGLTVLTGETGAGKTMVLTSLELLLGGRADLGLVRAGAQSTEVHGFFDVDEAVAQIVADEGGTVEDGELIVSRSVAAGRSRARLGGHPVPASTLGSVVAPLVTIHGQAEQMRLKSPKAQREMLDAAGGDAHREILSEYAVAWKAAVAAKKELDDALAQSATRADELAQLSQAVAAIDALDIHDGEDEELKAQAKRLMSIEDLRQLLDGARAALQGDENAFGATQLLREASTRIDDAAHLDDALGDVAARLRSTLIEADTLVDDLASYERSLDADPEKLAQVMARSQALKKLMEGRAADATELLCWAQSARQRLAELADPAKDPQAIRERLSAAQRDVLDVGEKLSASRKAIARRLEAAVGAELKALAMKDAVLHINVTTVKPMSHGMDDVVILLQSHPSAQPRPLGQGASGGELSRIMLALEVVLGQGSPAHTFVFDEVDAGIGGQTATEVGARLARLAKNRQVLVVTHLPQVAVFAKTHLVVTKHDGTTQVTRVEGEAREAELTRMMGGDPHSTAARRQASELLSSLVTQSQ